jgi:hypothetical protein
MVRNAAIVMATVAFALGAAMPAAAQPLGSFRWQLQPYCNIITVAVVQQGGQYQLDGTDDQCGAGNKASVVGLAFQNPTGTIGFGLTIVTAPGGTPVHVDATISIATLSGTWRDSAGNTGTFIFTPGAPVPGTPRPVPSGGLAANSVTTIQIAAGAVTNTRLAADAVTGATVQDGSLSVADLSNAPRAAFAEGGELEGLTTTAEVVRTVTLTIPSSGIVIVNASGYFNLLSAGEDIPRCSISSGTVIDFDHLIFARDTGTVAGTNSWPWGSTRGFNVTPGSFTVNLVCDAFSGTAQVARSQLNAIFIGQ